MPTHGDRGQCRLRGEQQERRCDGDDCNWAGKPGAHCACAAELLPLGRLDLRHGRCPPGSPSSNPPTTCQGVDPRAATCQRRRAVLQSAGFQPCRQPASNSGLRPLFTRSPIRPWFPAFSGSGTERYSNVPAVFLSQNWLFSQAKSRFLEPDFFWAHFCCVACSARRIPIGARIAILDHSSESETSTLPLVASSNATALGRGPP